MPIHLRTRKDRKGRVKYYLDVYHQGLRKRETLPIPFHLPEIERQRLAMMAHSQRSMQYLSTRYDIPADIQPRNFVSYFTEYADSRNDTYNKYRNTARHFKLCFGATLLTTHLNERKMAKWRQYLIDNFNGETPLTMWGCTRRVIRLALQDGLIATDPAKGVSAPPVKKNTEPKEVLYESELRTLASTPMIDPAICNAFLFCCFTGLELPKVRALKWRQINLAERKLRYQRSKNGVLVVVDLADTAVRILEGQDRSRSVVFPFLPSGNTCNAVLRKWVSAAGISKHITWYCARHSFAVLLLSCGADLETVRKLMGHTTLKHTAKYLQYADHLKQKAVDRLPKI